jgi:cell division protein FtsN
VKTWAALALGEADDGAGRPAEACRRYEALARARVSPAAWYRHAECLERGGEVELARREYEALAEEFAQTPEAVRAAEKLSLAVETATLPPPPAAEEPKGAGFTVQFGSFSDRANAIKLAARIKKTYPSVRVDSELVNFREVFRVRIGHYATRAEAQAAGESMSRALEEQFTIMPVSPSPHD